MNHDIPQFAHATSAIAHHTAPTTLCRNPKPRPQPPITGPRVRAAELTLWATPWIVPSTLGCGEELLIKMIALGSVKVRAIICRLSTATSAGQIKNGLSGSSARDGITVYAIGLNGKAIRYNFNVPNLVLSLG